MVFDANKFFNAHHPEPEEILEVKPDPRLNEYLSSIGEIELNEAAFEIGCELTIQKALGDGAFKVDWGHWLTISHWTPEQAVYLLNGIDPNAIECSPSMLGRSMRKLLQRDNARNDMTPYQWKQFGLEQGIPLPQQILDIQEPVDHQPEQEGVNDETGNQIDTLASGKPLKPRGRDRTEGTLLIYELLTHYGVTHSKQLSGPDAWLRIVSGEFTSKRIGSIAENKGSIFLTGEGCLYKGTFLDRYRKRFGDKNRL
jgi:hypothetical protein